LLAAFEFACVSISPQTAATAAAISSNAPLADVVSDTRLLDLPSNAARLDALQHLLKKRGLAFALQPFANSARQRDGREEGQNVLLEPFGGDGPLIILGAHLDAVPLSAGGQSHGMLDNGAGVVVVARVAEALRTRRLRHRIQVAFFDMEESGLLGSAFLAKSLDRTKVNAMVNVDIAGYGDTILSGPTTAAGSARLHQALARVCTARDYNCLRYAAFPGSDDRSFQAAGIPAISMAVLPELQAHQVWLLLNGGKESGLAPGFTPAILRAIHSPEDTADKLSAEGMTLIYNAVLGLMLELDAS
jgi:acetylornithine deacetylase/succinyl-diaminopimelate desuccinylase-like protein